MTNSPSSRTQHLRPVCEELVLGKIRLVVSGPKGIEAGTRIVTQSLPWRS